MNTSKPVRASLALLVFSASALSLTVAAADYYKWLDERGQVVISDRPPVDPTVAYEYHGDRFGQERTRLFEDDGEPTRGNVAGRGNTRDNPQNPETAGGVKPPSAADRKPDAAKCSAARERLFKLETFPRKRVEDNGEVRFMTSDEVEEQLRVNRELIERHCAD